MTTRPNSPALDALLGVAHPVLDHGFVSATPATTPTGAPKPTDG